MRFEHLRGGVQESNLGFLGKLNRRHAEKHPGEHELEARIASYELAARMQDAAREALDISQETEATHKLYGIDEEATREYGTRCLIARRLVERGVRFVQLFHAGQPWDNHNSLNTALPSACKKTDKPSAGLVKDLKQRGMLDEVLVHWGGEIGRLPVVEGDPKPAGEIIMGKVSAPGLPVVELSQVSPTVNLMKWGTRPLRISLILMIIRRRYLNYLASTTKSSITCITVRSKN